MGKVVLTFSMSLDGFIAGPAVSPAEPMGIGGERLHDWHMSTDELDRRMAREMFETVGAVVLGRTTFDAGLKPWGDTPYPAPSFVLTHERRAPLPMKSATFEFVNDGIAAAVARAKAAAGEGDIVVMGANVAQQCLEEGLADDIIIQSVPVLLGAGVRLFEGLGDRPIELEIMRALPSPSVIHQRFRVRAA
jgi:dihydrofolate reductase